MSAVPKKGTKTAAKKDAKAASRKGGKAADKGKNAKTTASKAVSKTGAKSTNKGNNTKANPKGNKGGAAADKKTGKGGKGGKGGKQATNKKQTKKNTQATEAPVESKEEEKVELVVDFGPPVELPETKEFISDIEPLKEFELKDDDVIELLKTQFEVFQSLLKARKKACLTRARVLVAKENEDTPPVCIDIEGMKKLIANIGIEQGEKEYAVNTQRTKCIDKAKELIAYETKLNSITKKLEATNKETVQEEIKECKKVLQEAEPVLEAAIAGLKQLDDKELNNVRALPKPNKLIVKTVKACQIMVGRSEKDLDGWPNIKKFLRQRYIDELAKFEARDITPEIRENLETNYLGINNDNMPDNEKLTFENVQKANAVAGNLVKWIEAQLKYNEFIPKVEPMQAKLKELEVKLLSIEGIVDKYQTAITELNKRIETAKRELREEGKLFSQANAACKPQSLVQA